MDNFNLRMSFNNYLPANAYDPAKIHFAPEYAFLENIYSPLVEYSPSGELVSAVAEKFAWVGSEAHFRIRPNLKTIDGYEIDARDVETAFKRSIILGGTHGDLKKLLCPDSALKTLSDVCAGMEVRDKNQTLVMKFKSVNPFLFPMLAAIDFAVIPRGSINMETLAIQDYRNTSGPYYVQKDSLIGEIVLTANPHSFHYSKNIPQTVTFVPSGKNGETESLDLFSANKVDYITCDDKVQSSALLPYAKAHPEASVHQTYPIHLHFIRFTKKGRSRLSEQERIAIGKHIRKQYLAGISSVDTAPAEQMFPTLSEGQLTKAQLAEVKSKFDSVPDDVALKKDILIWDIGRNGILPSIFKSYPSQWRIEHVRKIPEFVDFTKEKLEEPDLVYLKTDMGFQEDINLLTYQMNVGTFYQSGEAGKKWLAEYMSKLDKTERMRMIKEEHFRTLSSAYSIPLAWSTYSDMVRKPWVLGLSKLHSNNPAWRLYQK